MTKNQVGRPLGYAAGELHDAFVRLALEGGLTVETAASACGMVRENDDVRIVVVCWHLCSKFFEVESGLELHALCRHALVANPWSSSNVPERMRCELEVLRRNNFVVPRSMTVHELLLKDGMSRTFACALLWHDAYKLRDTAEWEEQDFLSAKALLRVLRCPLVATTGLCTGLWQRHRTQSLCVRLSREARGYESKCCTALTQHRGRCVA